MALNRSTNATLPVERMQGKIAIEEAVDCPFFNGNSTLPPTPMIAGMSDPPFSEEFKADIKHRLRDVPSRLASMDQSGLEYTILSLTSPGIEGIFDAKEAVEIARKTNDYIYETYVKAYPKRFGFFACVAMQDPSAAAKELERAVKDLGAKGVLINGFCNLDQNDTDKVQYLDEPQCAPLWKTLSELDVPLYIHPRPAPPSQQILYRNLPNLAQAAYGFGVETGGHALRIMCSGILDTYPNLKIILGHCGEALPFLIHRVDERMKIGTPGSNGPYKKTCMEYLIQNFYATCAGVRRESTLMNAIAEMGEERVMFSVDYPYESNEEACDWFDGLTLSGNTKKALAYGNAKKLFGL